MDKRIKNYGKLMERDRAVARIMDDAGVEPKPNSMQALVKRLKAAALAEEARTKTKH